MIEKYLNNRFLTLYIIPFIFGLLTTLSFQPFNLTLINFFNSSSHILSNSFY